MQSGTALIADACPVLGLFPRFIHVQTPNLPQTQLCKSWWLFRRWGWRWPAPMAWHILKTQNQICSKWKHRGFGPCVLGASHVQDSSAFSRDAMADKPMHGILHGMFSWVLSKVVTEQSRAQSFSVLLKTSQHARFKRLSFGTVQNNLKEATRGGRRVARQSFCMRLSSSAIGEQRFPSLRDEASSLTLLWRHEADKRKEP